MHGNCQRGWIMKKDAKARKRERKGNDFFLVIN